MDTFNMKLMVIFSLLMFSIQSLAQEGFRGSLFAGMTAAQLGGDSISGYNKLGLTTGLKVSYRLSDKFELNLDLSYVQKGSRESIGFSGGGSNTTTLHYAQLPVYLTLNDWYISKDDYYKVGAFAGLSYSYLISVATNNPVLKGLENSFRKSDLGGRIGVYYSFSKRLTLRIFYTDSFLNVLEGPMVFRGNTLDSFYWTFRTEYNF